ncbi:MAG: ATP-dependent DNA helicase [Candidatus Woesearchaeota archaeon]|jgi:DNA helicase-2/ATP-dependent DNA helicase PcrA|nr:ATP-dependent DNA helicase [Candidatus Woesearchaeota archaeon]
MLNSEQKNAVKIIDKPLVVIAGPGTGKTHMITEKINFLLEEKKYSEDEILPITFTKKAAAEMSERVEIKTSRPFFAKTFHEFALEIIDTYQNQISMIDKDFSLIDETNQLLFFLDNLKDMKFTSFEMKNNYVQIAHEIVGTISKLKDFGYSLEDLVKLKVEDINLKSDLIQAYSKYELYKRENNYLDFGDLLLYVFDLLKNNLEVRDEIKNKYKYILVDEFQDTNKIQLDIIKLISGENITIVGDQKQSIYSFRGANFSNLGDFKAHYKNYEEVFLHKNYRSSKSVLNNINKLVLDIASNDEVLENVFEEKGEVSLIEASNSNSQDSFIAQRISNILEKEPEAKIGVLFRRKFELTNTAKFLKNLGISFNANEAINFFEQDIIKDVLNKLKIIENPRGCTSEYFKFLSDCFVSYENVRKIMRKSSFNEKSIFKTLMNLKESDDYGIDFEVLKKIYSDLDFLIKFKDSKRELDDLLRETIFKFGNFQRAFLGNNFEGVSALNNFVKFARDYIKVYRNSNLSSFLKVCENSKRLDIKFEQKSGSKVELLTLHSSKGKEFDYVIMPNLNERKFPSNFMKSKFDILGVEDKKSFVEEENRLFFVGITRSRKELDLVYVRRFVDNKLDSKPSNFLEVLGLNVEKYDVEFDELKLDFKEDIKVKMIDKITSHLISENFDLAKSDMEKLKLMYAKKDLNYFFNKDELDFTRIEKKDPFYDVDVDFSSHVYSVSQIKTYQSCPKKYLYQYVYRVPGESKHYFDFGTSVHSVLEEFVFDIRKFSSEICYGRAAAMLKEKWISKGYASADQEKEYFQKGLEVIKKFIFKEKLFSEDETREVIGIEDKFVINLEGKKILGFIDRVDKVGDNFVIIDYKTSNSMETKMQLKKNIQLFVYALAIEHLRGKLPSKVGLWYLIHDELVEVEVSEIDFDKMKAEVLDAISNIEKKVFLPTPSFFNCTYCDFNEICLDSKK